MMTDAGVCIGGVVGRLMRRSVVRSWEPCAGVSGNRDTLHPLSSSRLQGFKLTYYRWLTPWTPCPSRGRLLAAHDGNHPSRAQHGRSGSRDRAARRLGHRRADRHCHRGVALVIYGPHGGHAAGSSWLPAINASLNGTATVLLGTGYVFIRRRRIAAHRTCMIAAFAASLPHHLPDPPRPRRLGPLPRCGVAAPRLLRAARPAHRAGGARRAARADDDPPGVARPLRPPPAA